MTIRWNTNLGVEGVYWKMKLLYCVTGFQSLGCTLYAMCYGESPFDQIHRRGDSIALAVQTGNVKLPSSGYEYNKFKFCVFPSFVCLFGY